MLDASIFFSFEYDFFSQQNRTKIQLFAFAWNLYTFISKRSRNPNDCVTLQCKLIYFENICHISDKSKQFAFDTRHGIRCTVQHWQNKDCEMCAVRKTISNISE